MTSLPSGERERRLDEIRKYAEQLQDVSTMYSRLVYLAEQEKFLFVGDEHKCSDAFLYLAEAAGKLTSADLKQLLSMLEMLWRAGQNDIKEINIKKVPREVTGVWNL